jgi:hypothetical protein
MASTAQSPVKVYEHTKAKLRHAASVKGIAQAELLEKAVDEYVANHREDFAQLLGEAKAALLGGSDAAVAYALDLSEDEMAEIAGPRES